MVEMITKKSASFTKEVDTTINHKKPLQLSYLVAMGTSTQQ
jgi:hypothetical protein